MGPLAGVKIVELAGIGPGPMCAMTLADLGATVLRIERKTPSNLGFPRPLKYNLLLRGREQIAVDLISPAGVGFVLSLVEEADGLIEGYRPGVAERLGLGPDACLARNPRLVCGRMTGWGQSGPLATAAAHDLNYIALTGALAAIGRKGQPPTPPLTLVGDLGGGALYLALGIACRPLWLSRARRCESRIPITTLPFFSKTLARSLPRAFVLPPSAPIFYWTQAQSFPPPPFLPGPIANAPASCTSSARTAWIYEGRNRRLSCERPRHACRRPEDCSVALVPCRRALSLRCRIPCRRGLHLRAKRQGGEDAPGRP